jgi:deoxyguanosine kinase
VAERLGLLALPENLEALTRFEPWINDPNPDNTFALQLEFLLDVADRQASASSEGGVVERLLPDNFLVFVQMRRARGQLTGDQIRFLRDFYGSLLSKTPRPQLAVFLEADSDTLWQRTRNRGRGDDAAMVRDELDQIVERYQSCFEDWQYCPALRLNAALPVERLADQVLRALAN